MKNSTKNRKKIGLALGGGGAHGLAHIGVLKALKKTGIKIDVITGSSIGALIAAGYAMELPLKEIETLAYEISSSWKKLFSILGLGLPTKGVFDGHRIENFVRDKIGEAQFSDAKIPLAIVATDLISQKKIVFNQGNIARAIRASICFPFFFVPFEYEGKLLIDGSLTDPVPVKLARELGADYVIAVNLFSEINKVALDDNCLESNCLNAGAEKNEGVIGNLKHYLKIPNIAGVAMRTIGIMERHLAVPQLLDADLVINPDMDSIKVLEFFRTKELIASGEKAAEAALKQSELA